MKRVVTLLSALLLGTLVSTSVYAAANTDVWYETDAENDGLSVSVETNGEATDGVFTISYDTSKLSCSEEDVEISPDVDMHSVNVVDGEVRVSFLAEDAINAGTIATIPFKPVDNAGDLENAIGPVRGELHDEEGKELIFRRPDGEVVNPPKDPANNPGGNPNPSVKPGDVSTSTAAAVNTADTAGITYLMLALTAGVLLMTVVIVKTKAGIGRKVNK